ncbi:MAG: glycoside hydrolase family 31 protein [Pantoea sp.]|nr:glycoside hydrolase family 31 protein [Pantoea sp.]
MKTLKNWTLSQHADHFVELKVDNRHLLRLYVLESGLMRVLLKRDGELALNRTWSIAPGDDVPWEGRDRESLDGFGLPGFQLEHEANQLRISTDRLRVTVHHPLCLSWEHYHQGQWQPLAADRHTGAYLLNAHGDGVEHYQRRQPQDRVYTLTQRDGVSFGLFYDNLSSSWLDLGNELDNYHLPYRRYRAEAGDLDYYLMLGPRLLDVTQAFVRLTGRTIFQPKWSLGYSGSTMHYTDAPDAQQQLQGFIRLCREHEIPCDSFQLSSGYTSINNKRYVFNWNYDKVPNPNGMSAAFHAAGMKLAANIKPCLLQDHPRYQEVASQGLFIRDSELDRPERSVFWDDEGSHLDFTHPQAVRWWQENVTAQLLEKGIDATWNDNNEYEVWDGEARCHGFGQSIAIKHIRPVMPLLMMRASLEAQQRFAPEKRPYLISRSGCAGMQRYVQTWSGDNRTSWQTLRYNIRMGLGMSLSGLFNVGHDVGGFSGDKPDAELFVRWVQNGVMHPRFTIHSWNDDHTVNEPWMYPEVTPLIREAIRLRYRLMPYLYTLLWQASAQDEPMLRPTFLDHEEDSETWRENDDFLLGRDLLVASVVEEGSREREVYLPRNAHGWYDWHSGQWLAGGQTVTLDAPLDRLPLLARAGSAIPLGRCESTTDARLDSVRELQLWPAPGEARTEGEFFDDDGESHGWRQGNALWIRWALRSSSDRLELTLEKRGDYQPAWREIEVLLPARAWMP